MFYMIQVYRSVQKDWATMVIDADEKECKRLLIKYRDNNEFKKKYRLVRCEIVE